MEKSKIAIPVIEKRKLQAEVIIAIYDEMKEAFGEIKAKKILEKAIIKNAVSEGSKLRQEIDKKVDKKTSVINRFINVFELWKVGGALEIKEIKKTNEVYHFDVTRCKYAEMYDEMGIKDLGKLLSCNRDYNFSIGFDQNLKLERNKTIMEGHKCCTFRYQSLKRI